MEITIGSPPRTMMEVYEMLPEGTLAELIDNQLFMSPAPNTSHFKTAKKIAKNFDKLIEEAGRGFVFYAPFDVYLDKKQNAVQPDIFIVLASNAGKIETHGNFIGVPDLIVEVLSPSNKEYDMTKKKNLYEKFGVQEYWIVDPDTKLALGFALNNNLYNRISEEIGKIRSPLLNAEFEF
ncbi:MAG: Uma2 family endonuclease [Bacteroidota bacterium]|jgi:Uma2 family endonuclease|nr:Uma2 family endonuclease [Cytophagales bacterium]MCE2956455.1 Uma2 family endonuclease [Flammeovirgaceae bacterium]MCZ8069630.1 Uma2 family endonuclease [Cytophagales bacterium]